MLCLTGAVHLAGPIGKVSKGLCKLSLSHCGLTSKGVQQIANSFSLNQSISNTLTYLDLSGNNLKDDISVSWFSSLFIDFFNLYFLWFFFIEFTQFSCSTKCCGTFKYFIDGYNIRKCKFFFIFLIFILGNSNRWKTQVKFKINSEEGNHCLYALKCSIIKIIKSLVKTWF